MTAENRKQTEVDIVDILIIGGGVNGAGVARDAAGRGFSVCLCDQGDFAGGTSSASTKLFHGGLRYLEYFEFNLVRKALIEREVLLRAMPHISWPMRFVLPLHDAMTFEGETPASKLLNRLMPWMRGKRPDWVIRLGLFFYDYMGGRKILPPTETLDLTKDAAGASLKEHFVKAFEYSDCWIDDARLVIGNLCDARERGAQILPRTRVETARFEDGLWHVSLAAGSENRRREVRARTVVNAAGPWVDEVLKSIFGQNDASNVRLVRGSHIVVPKKFEHDRSYFFQNADGRIIFAIPYEQDYTLIGTTDADHDDIHEKPAISDEELNYLCAMATEYFKEPVRPQDVVWTYSGIRPLFDDGSESAQSATRDYIIMPDPRLGEGSLINIFGGKITTYRKLAEAVLEPIDAYLQRGSSSWTAGVPLPGGDFPVDAFDDLVARMEGKYSFLEKETVVRLCHLYGVDLEKVMSGVAASSDLGTHFGLGLYEVEIDYLRRNEWAQTAEDILYRRTKLGVHMQQGQRQALQDWLMANPL